MILKSFIQYLQEEYLIESVRQGLPHISTMDHKQLLNLVKTGKVHIDNTTEKTDGNSFVFGHDENGFYSQSTASGKEKMRTPDDYLERATRRTKEALESGKTPPSMDAAKNFAHTHQILMNNQALQDHLRQHHENSGQEVKVRGELLYRPGAKEGDHPGEKKFVATSYSTRHMGRVGKIILHSQLPENQEHDIEHFKKHLSNHDMNFDDDKVQHDPVHVDVSDEHKELSGLNHDLLNSRTTKTNKEAKEQEKLRVSQIAGRIAQKVDSSVNALGLKPKWGSGSEGLVIHPPKTNQDAPRFKVTSDAFRQYRASDAAKWKK